MCGILGYSSLNKSNINKFPIKKILKTLEHRGPDSAKYIKTSNCYFAHTRLSIIGLKEKNALQPVVKDNKVLTFNGEIYNYKEISKVLNNSGIKDSGKSDTETLFNCLSFYGLKKTLSIIDGMYAFAYFDQSKNLIYIARDKIGEKPLYWGKVEDQGIGFASELSSFNSIPTQSLPCFIATSAVVPLPINGSNTTPSSGQHASIGDSINFVG